MNLADLNTKSRSEQGIEVELLHPKTNTPVGIYITVLGSDSEVFRKTSRKQLNRRMEVMRRGKNAGLSAEEVEAEGIELLSACTKSWRSGNDSFIEIETGQKLECTPDNAKKLYSDPGFTWIKEQIDREIGDRSNFL